MNIHHASRLASKVANRVRWERLNLEVRARRALLDVFCSPNEQRLLLERSRTSTPAESEAVFEIPLPAAIEPRFGYVVHGRMGLIEASLPQSKSARLRSERQYFSGVPSVLDLVRRRAIRHVAGLPLSVRHPYDHNYFHAIVDCIGSIALLDEQERLARSSVVIGPALARTEVFRVLSEAGILPPSRWIVQDDCWIVGEAGVAFSQFSITARSLHRTRRFLERCVPTQSSTSPVKLYVTRDSGQGRNLRNEAELRAALVERGFLAVDPGRLPWVEQVRLFRRATHVVGVHGAALTNILFRAPEQLNLLEIQAPLGSEPMFRSMARVLGYQLETVFGRNPSERGNRPSFDVDVREIIEKLDSWTPSHNQDSSCEARRAETARCVMLEGRQA